MDLEQPGFCNGGPTVPAYQAESASRSQRLGTAPAFAAPALPIPSRTPPGEQLEPSANVETLEARERSVQRLYWLHTSILVRKTTI